MNKNINLKVKD